MPNNDGKNIDNANQNADNAGLGDTNLNSGNGDQQTVPLATFLQLKGELKSLKDKNTEYENNRKKEAEEKLKQDGELQKLLDVKQSEIDNLKSQLQSFKVKADAYDELENQERLLAKDKLGEKWDEDYNNIPIKTLRKIISTVSIPNAIHSDNGSGIKTPTKITLTKAQEAERDLMFSNIQDEKVRTENYAYAKGLIK